MNPQKIARICWNTNGWVKPSGWDGKAKSNCFEMINGYGHEEWLFDFDKCIEKYYYSFLQPISANYKKYIDDSFDILLYTIDSNTRKKYLVGELKNIIVINIDEAEIIYNYYIEKAWLVERSKYLENLGISSRLLKNRKITPWEMINIKFKPRNAKIYSKLIELSKDAISTPRYILLNMPNNFKKLNL